MRQADVYYKGEKTGELTQHDDGSFSFRYRQEWLLDSSRPAISLTMPKEKDEYRSVTLFPFFYNMLPEGANKMAICQRMRIEEEDHFGLLLRVGVTDTIGAVTVLQKETAT